MSARTFADGNSVDWIRVLAVTAALVLAVDCTGFRMSSFVPAPVAFIAVAGDAALP